MRRPSGSSSLSTSVPVIRATKWSVIHVHSRMPGESVKVQGTGSARPVLTSGPTARRAPRTRFMAAAAVFGSTSSSRATSGRLRSSQKDRYTAAKARGSCARLADDAGSLTAAMIARVSWALRSCWVARSSTSSSDATWTVSSTPSSGAPAVSDW